MRFLVVAGAGIAVALWAASRSRQRRRQALAVSPRDAHRRAADLPLVVDLLVLALGSAMTPYQALRQLVRWVPGPMMPSFVAALRELESGVSFAQALHALRTHAPELSGVARALLAAHHGAPVQPLLARLAAEDRAELRRCAEERARRIPVLLLFPLVLLILPAFVLCTVGPLIITHAAVLQ
ncbi:MAG: type II secretion system F family protein [Acidimicrobiia bacterium]